MIAPNSMPICDRIMRWISSCRRDTGAGKRNWISASEKSSRPLSTGRSQRERGDDQQRQPPNAGAARRRGSAVERRPPRRRARAAPRSTRAAHPREDAEVEVGGADDRADQIPRLAQPAQPHAQPVPRAAAR